MANNKGFIYKKRKELGYTQQEMAEKLYISINTYRSYELGKRQAPYEVFIKLLELTNTENDKKLIECLRIVYER